MIDIGLVRYRQSLQFLLKQVIQIDYPIKFLYLGALDKTFLNSLLYAIDMNICVSKVFYNLIERPGKRWQRLYVLKEGLAVCMLLQQSCNKVFIHSRLPDDLANIRSRPSAYLACKNIEIHKGDIHKTRLCISRTR